MYDRWFKYFTILGTSGVALLLGMGIQFFFSISKEEGLYRDYLILLEFIILGYLILGILIGGLYNIIRKTIEIENKILEIK